MKKWMLIAFFSATAQTVCGQKLHPAYLDYTVVDSLIFNAPDSVFTSDRALANYIKQFNFSVYEKYRAAYKGILISEHYKEHVPVEKVMVFGTQHEHPRTDQSIDRIKQV